MKATKRRRADGTLRPCVIRRNKKRRRKLSPERKAWLANFRYGDRPRFFHNVIIAECVWLNGFAKETGLPRYEAARALEAIAEKKRWRKLRTLDGTVVGIGPQDPKKNGGWPPRRAARSAPMPAQHQEASVV